MGFPSDRSPFCLLPCSSFLRGTEGHRLFSVSVFQTLSSPQWSGDFPPAAFRYVWWSRGLSQNFLYPWATTFLSYLLETKDIRQFKIHGPNNNRIMVICHIFLKVKVSRSFTCRQVSPDIETHCCGLSIPGHTWVLFWKRSFRSERGSHAYSRGVCCPKLFLWRLGLRSLFPWVWWPRRVIPCNFRTEWVLRISKWGPPAWYHCANRKRLSDSKANESSVLWLENGEVQAWALEGKLSWEARSPAASYYSLRQGQGRCSGGPVELCCSLPGCLSSSCCLWSNKTNFEIVLLIFLFLYPMKKVCCKAISVF